MIIYSYVLEDQADAHVEVAGGEWFLHVNVFDNVPSVYKWLRKLFQRTAELAKEEGKIALFAHTPNPSFCHAIRDVDNVEYMGDSFYLVTWRL